MGRRAQEIESPTLVIGETSSRLIKADQVFEEVNNMYPTEEGGYHSILGLHPYVRANSGFDTDVYPNVVIGTPNNAFPITYGNVHGIHHAYLKQGQREVLLVHMEDQVWECHPWDQAWSVLLGPSSSSPQQEWNSPDPTANDRWPTQFITTPLGVVIVPQGGRAFFYDGETVAPFGFSRWPGPPTGHGPDSSRSTLDTGTPAGGGVNDAGYAHNRLQGRSTRTDDHYGFGRIGTTESLPTVSTTNPSAGTVNTLAPDEESAIAALLLEGVWRARVAYRDQWGNSSALSPESHDVTLDRQHSTYIDNNDDSHWAGSKAVRQQFAWSGIGGGPVHAIGKDLYRTKDMLNTGDSNFYLLSNDAQVSQLGFATIQDRETRFFPDNIPDAWLSVQAPELDPCPIFRLGAMAFGRFWAANLLSAPGTIKPSLPGRYGTFPSNQEITPDPTGGQVTGIHTVEQGLLVFTETSTFLIVPNDAGDGFRSVTLSSTVGCMAPNSIVSTRFGMTIWLGRDGFYGYDGGRVTYLFDDHRDIARYFSASRLGASCGHFNPRSGQYECWVAWESSLNPNRRYKFDGRSWHWDDYDGATHMVDTTVPADHRGIVIGCGKYTANHSSGVWVHDAGHDTQPATLKTGWVGSIDSRTKRSVRQVALWLRETSDDSLSIALKRNYRAETKSTVTETLYPDISTSAGGQRAFGVAPTDIEPNPDFWDVDVVTGSVVRRRRPFWSKVTVDVPVCESFQLVITATGPLEVIGLTYSYEPRDEAGASSRR